MRLLFAVFTLVALHGAPAMLCAQGDASGSSAMLQTLQQIVQNDPSDGDAWRLIGRIHREQGRHVEAYYAFQKAIAIEPGSAAAHYDLGELFEFKGNEEKAKEHFDQVIQLAPESEYAAKLIARNAATAPVNEPRFVADSQQSASSGEPIEGLMFPVVSEADLETGEIDFQVEPIDHVRMIIEGGAMYSTNVSLAPISRELTPTQAAGFQAFVSPDIEWAPLRTGGWRGGPSLRGFFTLNENQFRPLDIASFRPGLYLERDFSGWIHGDFSTRIDYSYTLDLIGGSRFGDRHSVVASATMWPDDAWFLKGYVGGSWADFASDGANPATDSLDGPAFNAGLSRTLFTDSRFLTSKTFGFDYERVDTQGDDFRYNAVSLRGGSTFQLTQRLEFITQTGIGFRHYGDFTGMISRDELTLRGGARLQWKLRDDLLLSTVFDHNRFFSINESFDTERTEAGVTFTILR